MTRVLILADSRQYIRSNCFQLQLHKSIKVHKKDFKIEYLYINPKKLQNFEELTFEEFVTEYTKSIKLKFADKLAERNFKQEWQAIFENDKTLACGFKTEIQITDKISRCISKATFCCSGEIAAFG